MKPADPNRACVFYKSNRYSSMSYSQTYTVLFVYHPEGVGKHWPSMARALMGDHRSTIDVLHDTLWLVTDVKDQANVIVSGSGSSSYYWGRVLDPRTKQHLPNRSDIMPTHSWDAGTPVYLDELDLEGLSAAITSDAAVTCANDAKRLPG